MTTATKTPDWGDGHVGFEQHHPHVSGVTASTAAHFYLTGPVVEIRFNSTVYYGGGVQHSADGSLVLTREDARALAVALADLAPTTSTVSTSDEIRNQALEEAAKVCGQYASRIVDPFGADAARDCASEIRDLRTSTDQVEPCGSYR